MSEFKLSERSGARFYRSRWNMDDKFGSSLEFRQALNISINRDGQIYWNLSVVDANQLLERLKSAAVQKPQPEVHVRADQMTRYEFVGKVILTAQRAGIQKVGFITEPGPTGSQY